MRTLVSLAAAVLLSLGLATAEPSPSDAFSTGSAAFAEQDYLRALSHFQTARDEGLDGPSVHYNIAVCHYKLGDYASAHSVFARIAEQYPAMRGLAQYNLGLVALKRGDEAEAETFFEQALANSDDEKIRRLARAQLGPGTSAAESRPGRNRWFSLVETQLGHDDNVLLLADDIRLSDGQSGESAFTELQGFVTGPLSSEPGFRLDASLYSVRYADASIFDQTLLRLGAAYDWRWGAWHGEAGPHVNYTTLDGDAFEQRVGVGVGFRRAVGPQSVLRLRYVHDEITEGEDRFAYLDGSREWFEARVDRRGAHGRLTLAYAYEDNDRFGARVSSSRHKLSTRYRYTFNPSWRGDIEVAWRESRYDELAEPRDETLGDLSLGLARSLARGWEVNGEVSAADNDSDLATVAYDRNRISFGFTKQF